jgi:hypothetical protein
MCNYDKPVKLVCGHEMVLSEGWHEGWEDAYCQSCMKEGECRVAEALDTRTPEQIACDKAFMAYLDAKYALDLAMGKPQLFEDSDDE